MIIFKIKIGCILLESLYNSTMNAGSHDKNKLQIGLMMIATNSLYQALSCGP